MTGNKNVRNSPGELAFARGFVRFMGLMCDSSEEGEAQRQEVRDRISAETALMHVRQFGYSWVMESTRESDSLKYGLDKGLFRQRDVDNAEREYQSSQRK